MKSHWIKFFIFLNLCITQAFADNWGDVHVAIPFPQKQADIASMSGDISSEIETHLSLGHGVYEDSIIFTLTSLFNDTFQTKDYENIINNALKAAPRAQYIIFDVTQLNSVQIVKNQNVIYQLEKDFLLKKRKLKFGFIVNYGSEPDTDARMFEFITENPVPTAYLAFQGDWVSFINALARTPNPFSYKNIEFLDFSSIEVDETNVSVLASFLQKNYNLKALILSSIFLKQYTNFQSPENDNKLLLPIVNVLKNLTSISYLNFSSNAFNESSAEMLASAIKQWRNLVYINLKFNNFSGNGANILLRSIAQQKLLSFIDIGYNRFDVQNADDFVNVIKDKPYLDYIDASYNYFSSDGSHKIRVAISNVLVLESLQVFKFRHNYYIYKHFADETKISNNFSKLFYIDIGENYFYTQQSTAYASQIKFPLSLKYLYLDADNMNGLRLAEITDALLDANHLVLFDVSNNNIDGGGVDSVVKILTRTQTLARVKIGGNNFTEPEMVDIANALSTLPEINLLDISRNKINLAGIQIIAKHFSQNRNLHQMFLSNVDLSNQSAIVLASALKAQTDISVLDVSFNNIDKSGLKSILNSLKNKEKFTTLILSGNKVSCDDVTTLIGTFNFKCV